MGRDLTEGGILKTILATSLPMMIAFGLQSAFNIVDTFFVGRISSEAIAAVSISFPVVFLMISLGTGIGLGTTSVIARLIGARRYADADNAAEHALLAAVVLSAGMTVAGILAMPALFDMIGAEGSLRAMAFNYINILLVFAGFVIVPMTGNGILRAEGDMITPMKVIGASAILNAILDPIFIYSFGWGVAGAAWATVVSQGLGMIYLAFHMLSNRAQIRLDLKDFRYEHSHIKSIFSVGIPSALSNMIMSAGMFLQTIIVGFFGVEALAAFGIGFRLDALAILPALGISVAVTSIVGQSLGAGKRERAGKITIYSGLMASGFMTVIGVMFYVFATPMIQVFDPSPLVVEYGTSFLQIIPLCYVFVGMAICISGAFIGAGKAVYALVLTVLRVILFSVPFAYVLSQSRGVPGIWEGMVLGSVLSFMVGLLLYYYSGWDKPARI
ncbi:MAG: MATE family efflux transporter [Candidatus Altiarchaeota archaeon]|nr:MATE family efflux transporter [Candidatus Altiarchaeota archaeon]